MALREYVHLDIVRAEAHEPETLGVARPGVLLDLSLHHIAVGLEVLTQILLGGVIGQAEHDEIKAAQMGLSALGFGS